MKPFRVNPPIIASNDRPVTSVDPPRISRDKGVVVPLPALKHETPDDLHAPVFRREGKCIERSPIIRVAGNNICLRALPCQWDGLQNPQLDTAGFIGTQKKHRSIPAFSYANRESRTKMPLDRSLAITRDPITPHNTTVQIHIQRTKRLSNSFTLLFYIGQKQ